MAHISIDEANSGERHVVEPGDLVTITLIESPTSGYRWTVESYDDDRLDLIGDEFVPDADAMTGGGGRHRFQFDVRKSRPGDIRLSMRRAWQKGTPAAREFRATLS